MSLYKTLLINCGLLLKLNTNINFSQSSARGKGVMKWDLSCIAVKD